MGPGLRILVLRIFGPGSRVPGSRVSGPRVSGLESPVPGSRALSSGSQFPGSRVPGPGFRLSPSQRQAVIKLIEKKERDKRFIKNWRPISLLNVDYKIIAKALATRLKETLPRLIYFQQTAYVRNRFTGEGGRLISDILEMSES